MQTDLVQFGGFSPRDIALVAIAIGALVIPLIMFADRRRTSSTADVTSGQVIGIVGRMGSGKSYMAVRMAHRRLVGGAKVATNFTMRLPPELAGNWQRFVSWDDLAALEDCVVIIDEAHLLAPSHGHLNFPMLARWKLAQARKFGLDVYWISQHEDRVNRTLRDLTNLIFVCQRYSIGGRTWFSALGFEPEKVRRKTQHIDRRGYWLDLEIAGLYDTLEILEVDTHLKGDDLVKAMGYAEARAARRGSGSGTPPPGRPDAPPAGPAPPSAPAARPRPRTLAGLQK